MKKKKKKKWVWCQTKPITIHTNYFYPTRKGSNLYGKEKVKLSKFVKCPDCKKRFLAKHRECEDNGCWHTYLPSHKKWIKIG